MSATQANRNRARTLAILLDEHAKQLDYAEVRPMSTAHLTEAQLDSTLKSGKSLTMDCSESVTLIFRLAGMHDPNGLGYNGQGYTGTMLDHLAHFTNWTKVHEGTLIVFGAGTGSHVVMVTHPNGENPNVFSHGSYTDKKIVPLAVERAAHPGQPVRLLAIDTL